MNQSGRLTQLEGMLKEDPNDSFLLFAVAKEHEGLDNKEEALEFYHKLTSNHPDYVGTYYHLGKLLEKTAGDKAAIEIYTKGMEVAKSQGDKHAHSELAGAKMEIDEEY